MQYRGLGRSFQGFVNHLQQLESGGLRIIKELGLPWQARAAMVYRSWLITWLLQVPHRLRQGWYQLWQWLRWMRWRPEAPPSLTPATPPPLPWWRRWWQQLLQQLRRFPLLRGAPPRESLPSTPEPPPLPLVPVAPVLPEPIVEVPSVAEGYEPHWLEQLLQWLDRVFYFWEQKIQGFWHWLRGFWCG